MTSRVLGVPSRPTQPGPASIVTGFSDRATYPSTSVNKSAMQHPYGALVENTTVVSSYWVVPASSFLPTIKLAVSITAFSPPNGAATLVSLIRGMKMWRKSLGSASGSTSSTESSASVSLRKRVNRVRSPRTAEIVPDTFSLLSKTSNGTGDPITGTTPAVKSSVIFMPVRFTTSTPPSRIVASANTSAVVVDSVGDTKNGDAPVACSVALAPKNPTSMMAIASAAPMMFRLATRHPP